MSKIVAALSVVAILMLTGCFAPDSGDEGDSSAAGDPGTAGSSEQGDGATADNEPDENEADENETDENEADGSGDEEDDGSDESEDDPAPASGPCDAVVPFEDVSGLINDPSAGAMTTGGDILNQCEWLSSDGDQSLLVSARDAELLGAQGIGRAYRKSAIKNLGEEAGSRLKTGMASVQVYAFVKGAGKAQPVLYTVTWKGEDVEVNALINIAKRIA